MATIKDKDISEFPRNTGPVRVYKWKDKIVMSAVGRRGTVLTVSQKMNALRFKLLLHVIGPSNAFVRIGFAAFQGRPRDRALKVNYSKAVVGDYPDMEVDYAALQLSEGPLTVPQNAAAKAGKENSVDISWTYDTDGNAADCLMVSLFNPTLRQAIVYTEAAHRADTKVSLAISPTWNNMPFHVYAAYHGDGAGSVSDTVYLGPLQLDFLHPVDFDTKKLFKSRIRKPCKKKNPENFNIDGISGRLGSVNLFTDRRGVVVMRANPSPRKSAQTLGEKMNMSRFSLMSHFLSKVCVFYTIGFDAHKSRTHVRSAAMTANLREEVVGKGPNFAIDYLAVQLSEGPLAPPRVTKARRENNTALFSWASDGNNGIDSPDDTLLVALYNAEKDEAVVSQTVAKRSGGEAAVPLPDGWNDNGCIAYLAFHNADNNICSPTTAITIK